MMVGMAAGAIDRLRVPDPCRIVRAEPDVTRVAVPIRPEWIVTVLAPNIDDRRSMAAGALGLERSMRARERSRSCQRLPASQDRDREGRRDRQPAGERDQNQAETLGWI
jgi:hypothetical protein